MTGDRLPFLMFICVGLLVVIIAGLATGSWWVFGIALAVHLIATAFVMANSARTARTGTLEGAEAQRLEHRAAAAVPEGRPHTLENELEALKHQPAERR